jgi:hypothetical protein
MKWRATHVLITLSVVAVVACGQTATGDPKPPQEAKINGHWIDPSTKLMWAGKDNGKDVHWHKASRYCHDLRLEGFSDWRLATIDELQGIYDRNAEAPGLAGPRRDDPVTWHVKGNLFLTGDQWSSTRTNDDRGRPTGYAWYFNFNEGRRITDPLGYHNFKHALCVRPSKN